jgi:N,N'-diacetyllegionaminate synthase
MAMYQKNSLQRDVTQFEMLQRFHLDLDVYRELKDYCKDKVAFASTAFDHSSLKLVASLEPHFIKVPSGEITNLPLLREIGALKRTVLISTGMSNLDEISQSLKVIEGAGTSRDDMVILHCTSAYPAPPEDLNLKAILTLSEKFGCQVGYSDHSLGVLTPVIAVALGASVIEKHFTLDRNMEGPDHKASLEPDELSEMVRLIRQTEISLGSHVKFVTKSEQQNIEIARRSIVARIAIKKGEIFNEKNLIAKRPGVGLSPMSWDLIMGRRASRDYEEDDFIDERL